MTAEERLVKMIGPMIWQVEALVNDITNLQDFLNTFSELEVGNIDNPESEAYKIMQKLIDALGELAE